jgi:manganese transport system permease protein
MFTALWQAIVEPFQFAFMVKALGVGILVGIVCAVLSCFITLKGWSLMGDAVSHSVLPGVVLAYLIGAPFGIGAFVFGLAAVLLIGWVSARSRLRDDAIIGIVFTAFFGVGLILVSKLPDLGDWAAATLGYRPPLLDVRGILFGNVLGISDADIVQTVITGGVTLLIVLLFRRDLILFCFDPNHARAIGLNTGLLHYTLLALLALSTVAALQTIGIVLVVAMLVTPGAIAYMLTDRFGRMLALAVGASVASCIIGIYASYYLNASTGGCIVLTQAVLFLIVLVIAPKRGMLARVWAARRRAAAGTLIRQTGAA